MARYVDKPFGDRTQTCINRGVPGLLWTSYSSLQPLLNIFLLALGMKGNGERTLLQQVAIGLLSQQVIIFPYLVFAMGLEHRVQYRETRGKRAKRKA